jgi:hypothetical protein
MEARSTFYFYCFTYDCPAQTSYKIAIILDILGGLSGLQFISIALSSVWAIYERIVYLIFCLALLYFGFLAVMAFVNFSKNLSSGTLHPETTEYLKKRMYYVYYWPVIGIIQIVFGLIRYFRAGGSGSLLAFFLPILFVALIFMLLGLYGQLMLQRTITEANDVLGGTKSDLKQNQVL